MKNTAVLFLSLAFASALLGQTDSTGFAGDHLDLHGTLGLFKNSADIDAFEKALNTKEQKVNNLDLNADGEVDFIRVEEAAEGEAHVIILSVDLSNEESQDVAAITVERKSDEEIFLQIIGDADVYGEQMVLEPSNEGPGVEGGKGNASTRSVEEHGYCSVCMWPSVRFLYGPLYHPRLHRYHYGLYPEWWLRWRAVQWHSYSVQCNPWGIHFYPAMSIRCAHAHQLWQHRRVSCVRVHNHAVAVHSHKKANTGGAKKAQPKSQAVPKKEGAQSQGKKPHSNDPHVQASGGKKTNGAQPKSPAKGPKPGGKSGAKPAGGSKKK